MEAIGGWYFFQAFNADFGGVMIILEKYADPKVRSDIEQIFLRMAQIRKERDSLIVGALLDGLCSGARNFCPGVFRSQDPGDPAQRISDMIGGWPYVSESYPWPMTYSGDLPMQPIVQLQCSKVIGLLGWPMVEGALFQVWGPAFRDFKVVLDNLRTR
jgi:hypothetical protein